MKNQLITSDYNGLHVSFNCGGWFNATIAGDKFKKRPSEWLRLPLTKRTIDALCKKYDVGLSHFVKTLKGGDVSKQGTWLHPYLAVKFARWLSVDFELWCDEQIRLIIAGNHPIQNWFVARKALAYEYKNVMEVVKLRKNLDNKEVFTYHYTNEALMMNEVFSGKREPLNRDGLSIEDIVLLKKIEQRNIFYISAGFEYQLRKEALKAYVAALKAIAIAPSGARLASNNPHMDSMAG